MKKLYPILIFLLLLLLAVDLSATTWPRFRGVNQDGKSTETGLLKQWPENGPTELWRYTGIGDGYSSIIAGENALYTTGVIDKKEYCFALDMNGKLLWKTEYGNAWNRSYPEARTSPTIDGDRLYVMSGLGELVCLNRANGSVIWKVDMAERFNAQFHRWGIADSPVIYGDKVICTPGGPQVTMAALNKMTGATIWTTSGLSDASNYCTPLLIKHGNIMLLMTIVEKHFIGVNADNGKMLWQIPNTEALPDGRDINPNTPVYQNGMVYITSGYDVGGALYKIAPDASGLTLVWKDKNLDVHHGGVVLVNGYLYGSNWHNNRMGNWLCLDWKTGAVQYDQEWHCKGSLMYADGMLYCYDEKDGFVGLVKATPEKFDVVSSFEVTYGRGPFWAHPSISNGILYLRHGDTMAAYKIKAN